jgi:hypothetical protein
MSTTLTEDQLANLSDEEVMGFAVAPQVESAAEEPDTEEKPTEPENEGEAADAPVGSEADVLAGADDGVAPDGDAGGEVPAGAGTTTTAPAGEDKPEADVKADEPGKSEDKPETEKSEGKTDVDLKAFYDRVMGPIKANGKDIQVQSVDEVVRLMQMGANYTKKLQALQPSLKLLKMLENNNLLDEGKLTYLIDLDKKNPAAIQKFIKESGVDPLEIDTSVEPRYTPGNHKVSDAEIAFQTTLDELMLDQAGQDTVVAVNRTWDAESKKALYTDPNLLRLMHEQRQSGIYQKVSDEIDRRKMLGALPVGQPFIHAYLAVGKELDAQGLLTPKPAAVNQPSRVLETRPAIPKSTVSNNDKAKAASPTSTVPKKAAVQDFNPLSLSDEDFEKNAALAKRL